MKTEITITILSSPTLILLLWLFWGFHKFSTGHLIFCWTNYIGLEDGNRDWKAPFLDSCRWRKLRLLTDNHAINQNYRVFMRLDVWGRGHCGEGQISFYRVSDLFSSNSLGITFFCPPGPTKHRVSRRCSSSTPSGRTTPTSTSLTNTKVTFRLSVEGESLFRRTGKT